MEASEFMKQVGVQDSDHMCGGGKLGDLEQSANLLKALGPGPERNQYVASFNEESKSQHCPVQAQIKGDTIEFSAKDK